ncbi:sensor histidine kinase [Thalassotalea piscium]|uniref:histidine kinase n=1 Tax=Thalassotalea piscium TaxID=1230533 RepID=A0A7X0TSD5_9GAMM|nr:HAMP domain-containing sensor histidine kinase [Thalassotalea piscium]MBB6541965.1 signal transduction histidine kinase [Thalassotalea piscium]
MTQEKVMNEVELQRKKRIIQVFWLGQLAFLLASFHPILTEQRHNLFFLFIFSILLCFAYQQAQQNNLCRAANIIIIVITATILTFSWFNEGARDETLLIFPALITFAVLIGSNRGLFVMLFIIVSNVLVMGYLNNAEIIIHEVSGSGFESAVVTTIIFCVVFYSINILGSDLLKANKQLTQQQELLETEVKNRTKTLEQTLEQFIKTKNELADADKMASLGRLVVGVAHEINTPVGIAITAASLIQDKNEHILTSFNSNTLTRTQLQEYLAATEQTIKLLDTNLRRASDLVTDFKGVAVLSEEECRSVFTIGTLLSNIFNHLQSVSDKERFKVNIICPPNINAYQDPAVITRIVANLYSNSVKHGFDETEEGIITITVTVANSIIALTYQDNGVGVPTSGVTKIFEPFYTTKRGQGGTGLGLHIVYNLVTQSLGGEISYDGTFTHGAKFDISFNQNMLSHDQNLPTSH